MDAPSSWLVNPFIPARRARTAIDIPGRRLCSASCAAASSISSRSGAVRTHLLTPITPNTLVIAAAISSGFCPPTSTLPRCTSVSASRPYASWPAGGEGDAGGYAVLGGGDITADGGRDTVYLARLPADVKPGDTVRVHAHCLYHGEYVDFVQLPGE